MNNDVISRQAAIDALDGEIEITGRTNAEAVKGYVRLVRDRLERLPSAQQWTPVTERLPDLWDERYLVSLAWGGVGVMEYKSTGFHNYGSFSPVPIETVTAWMPLPDPWRGENNDRT